MINDKGKPMVLPEIKAPCGHGIGAGYYQYGALHCYRCRAEKAEATVARLTQVEAAAKEWRKHMDEPAHAALRRALSALGL